jgi:L-ascorbate metabolism protein UlaG (beta-lactamase superfamily)
MGVREAADVAALTYPKLFLPIHFGTFPISSWSWRGSWRRCGRNRRR